MNTRCIICGDIVPEGRQVCPTCEAKVSGSYPAYHISCPAGCAGRKKVKTMNKELIKKLTSRKFIVTAIAAIAGILTLIVGESETVNTVAGAAMTIVPTVVYCLMEGVIDAKSVKTVTEATADAAEQLGANKETVEMIEQIGDVAEVLTEPVEGDTEANA